MVNCRTRNSPLFGRGSSRNLVWSWCEATIASAGTSLSVGVNDLLILMPRLSLPQLPIDGLLHVLVGLRAVDEDAVDEERRRSIHARGRSRLQVVVDQRLLFPAVEALVELRRVHPQQLGVSLEIRNRELALVGEHLVVQLPELLLVLRARARPRRLLRAR